MTVNKKVTIICTMVAIISLSGQSCPPNANLMMPAPAPTPMSPVAGLGISVEDATVSVDTDFTDGLYWKLDGNAGTTAGSVMLGTTDDQPLELHVNGARALLLEPTAMDPNVIGGFSGNMIETGAVGATIGGGGLSDPNDSTTFNHVLDDYGTIGGGGGNQAGFDDGDPTGSPFPTVGGGRNNRALGSGTTVSGGQSNLANATEASVGGGRNNTASGPFSVVGGGNGNVAAGNSSTIPGGRDNAANNTVSFAAGFRAKADHSGAFVWGDNTDADVSSFGSNTFSVRATGGARFYSSANLTTGVELPAGAGAFSNLSDRNVKENFGPVDSREILNRVCSIRIESWNYKTQDDAIRHVGPMAQDFYAAFGYGQDERRISTIDADGVALAAIQGLHQIVRDQDREMTALRARLAALESQFANSKEFE